MKKRHIYLSLYFNLDMSTTSYNPEIAGKLCGNYTSVYGISSWLHSVFIIVEITVKTFRAIYIAKWHVFHASCVKVSVGAFSVGTRKHGPIWH